MASVTQIVVNHIVYVKLQSALSVHHFTPYHAIYFITIVHYRKLHNSLCNIFMQMIQQEIEFCAFTKYAISGLYMRFVSLQNQYVAIIHRKIFLMILVSRKKITVTLITRVSSWTHYFLAEVALVLGLDIRLILINELLQNNYRHAEKTFKV